MRMRLKSGGGLFAVISICMFLLVFLSACSSMNKQKDSEENLMKVVERYNSDLRWSNYKEASFWVEPSLQESFWSQADRLEGRLRITDFEIRPPIMWNSEKNAAEVTIIYHFYRTNDPRIETGISHQSWRYLPEQKAWQLIRPDLGVLTSE